MQVQKEVQRALDTTMDLVEVEMKDDENERRAREPVKKRARLQQQHEESVTITDVTVAGVTSGNGNDVQQQQDDPFDAVPDLPILHILSFLSLSDLWRARGVNRRWKQLAQTRTLWARYQIIVDTSEDLAVIRRPGIRFLLEGATRLALRTPCKYDLSGLVAHCASLEDVEIVTMSPTFTNGAHAFFDALGRRGGRLRKLAVGFPRAFVNQGWEYVGGRLEELCMRNIQTWATFVPPPPPTHLTSWPLKKLVLHFASQPTHCEDLRALSACKLLEDLRVCMTSMVQTEPPQAPEMFGLLQDCKSITRLVYNRFLNDPPRLANRPAPEQECLDAIEEHMPQLLMFHLGCSFGSRYRTAQPLIREVYLSGRRDIGVGRPYFTTQSACIATLVTPGAVAMVADACQKAVIDKLAICYGRLTPDLKHCRPFVRAISRALLLTIAYCDDPQTELCPPQEQHLFWNKQSRVVCGSCRQEGLMSKGARDHLTPMARISCMAQKSCQAQIDDMWDGCMGVQTQPCFPGQGSRRRIARRAETENQDKSRKRAEHVE